MSGGERLDREEREARDGLTVASEWGPGIPPPAPAVEPTHRLQGISTDRETGLPTLLVVGPRRRLIEVPLDEPALLDLIAGAAEQLRRLGRG